MCSHKIMCLAHIFKKILRIFIEDPLAAILDAILNISISPMMPRWHHTMMPRWHHSVSMYGHIGEHIYAKIFCADYFLGLHSKSAFGNRTKRPFTRAVLTYMCKTCACFRLACFPVYMTCLCPVCFLFPPSFSVKEEQNGR